MVASARPRFATPGMLDSETSQPLFGNRRRDAQPDKDLLVIKEKFRFYLRVVLYCNFELFLTDLIQVSWCFAARSETRGFLRQHVGSVTPRSSYQFLWRGMKILQ